MKFEPLLYFAELYAQNTGISQFAEQGGSTNNKYMATYHFDNISSNFDGIHTIWFDFYTDQYYYANIQFEDKEKKIMSESSYIDICYQLGGTILAWVISPQKSLLVYRSTNSPSVDMEIETLQKTRANNWSDLKDTIHHHFELERDNIKENIATSFYYTDRLTRQYDYRYVPIWGHWNEEKELWEDYSEDEILPELNYIEESLFDGTHDKLHDGGLMQYHQAGKPKKLALRWTIKKSDYVAYLWFDDNAIRCAYEMFYSQYPDAKMDFIFCIDVEKQKYQLLFDCEEANGPMILKEDAYQMIIFKSKFEYYRTPNYNQTRGAWVW